jgi:hypothetical protein
MVLPDATPSGSPDEDASPTTFEAQTDRRAQLTREPGRHLRPEVSIARASLTAWWADAGKVSSRPSFAIHPPIKSID